MAERSGRIRIAQPDPDLVAPIRREIPPGPYPIPTPSELDEAAIETRAGKVRILVGLFSTRLARWLPDSLLRRFAKRTIKLEDGLPSERLARSEILRQYKK